tara:strand:+ start:2302 stop:3219 length:918 start_codon:yes stop_codon:yes gene_type:complete
MHKNNLSYKRLINKYFKFIKSQEVLSEPFRDKKNQLDNFYLPICERIYKKYTKNKKTIIIGLTGGQGSGKSTISKILKIILKINFKLNTVIFSIDDFYKTLNQRRLMSIKESPLFLTRGVPGTHDTSLLINCLKNLKKLKFKKFSIPKFDKSTDNRVSKKNWQIVNLKPEIVIFEGWCVGAKPQKNKDLLLPVNDLEKEKDKNRAWRKRANRELKGAYKKVFGFINMTIFLKVPSFRYVYKWRLLQEKKLRLNSKGKKTMNKKQIKKFIMFYERITKHMLKNFSKKADAVINVDNKHRLKSIKFN